jgi:hypothetical protein
MNLSLEEHIQKSREAAAANRAKGNRHAEILSSLYTDQGRFLEEILQNAEDAYARLADGVKGNLRFSLYRDRLDVFHDGRDFDEADLMAITTFGSTTKSGHPEVNLIGKFGIGFRSVYAVTRQPEIHSGKWHFRIDDYEVLEAVDPVKIEKTYGTLIRLPFGEDKGGKVFRAVREALIKLKAQPLLFIKNIKEIEILIEGKDFRRISVTEETLDEVFSKKSLLDTTKKGDRYDYLVCHGVEKDENKFSFCFRLATNEKGDELVVREPLSPIFVYFPTHHQSGLSFLMHAAFTTNPTREFIPFDQQSAPENLRLFDRALRFLLTQLPKFSKYIRVDPSFFDVLYASPGPLKGIDEAGFHKALLPVLFKKKLIPVQGGVHETAENIAIADSKDIQQLLGSKELELLFQKKAWLDCGFDTFPDAKSWLKNSCKFREVDAYSFAFRLAVHIAAFKDKKRPWFIDLYSFLAVHPELWDELHRHEHYSLRTKSIIKLQQGGLSAAYDEKGNCLVSLTAHKGSALLKIDGRIASDERAMNFFRMLGIGTDQTAKPHEQTDVATHGHLDQEALTRIAALTNAALLSHGGKGQELLAWGNVFAKEYMSHLHAEKGSWIQEDQASLVVRWSDGETRNVYVAVREDSASGYAMAASVQIQMVRSAKDSDYLLLITRRGPVVKMIEHPQRLLSTGKLFFDPMSFILLD